MLTRKQHQLLMFIHKRLQETGGSPSFDEMKNAMRLKSKSGIHRLVISLEERGFVRRLPHRARALEVVRLPDDATAGDAPIRNRKVEALRRKELGGHKPMPGHIHDVSYLQLYGRIAAGTPIEALRDQSTMVEVPSAMLGKGNHYALEVEGDSMIEAGIMDGDTIIIKQTDTAETGDIVVALVDSQEVTLKRFHKKEGAIALEPANSRYHVRTYPPERVGIQGRLAGLLRKY